MKSEETIISEWQEMDSVDKILQAIRHHELDMQDYIAETVAAICNVEKEAMLGESDKSYLSQARWFFWYAYRYMTGETLEKLSLLTLKANNNTRKFSTTAIGAGYNKMSMLIQNDPLWEKRWSIIKRIIKLRSNALEAKEDNTIVVSIPRHLKDKIQITIKEKTS